MVPEILESRKHFSATVTQNPGGMLTVTGTADADTIGVTEIKVPADNDFGLPEGTPIVFVTEGVDATPIIAPDGNPFFQGVRHVRIVGKAGDDTLSFFGTDVSATIQGDDGNDTILIIDDADGNHVGSSIVYGGNGDDVFQIEQGNATIAFGEAGNDTFIATLGGASGQSGSAILFGNAGNDTFEVSGHVIAVGGAGVDTRIGEVDNQAIVLL